MAAVRIIKEGMTYNPDTGNYHVRDSAGNFTGDTTDRDVAERWHASGHVAVMSGPAFPAGTEVDIEYLMSTPRIGQTRSWVRRARGVVLGPVAYEPGMLRVRVDGHAVRVLTEYLRATS